MTQCGKRGVTLFEWKMQLEARIAGMQKELDGARQAKVPPHRSYHAIQSLKDVYMYLNDDRGLKEQYAETIFQVNLKRSLHLNSTA
jgi:hypothetical protein